MAACGHLNMVQPVLFFSRAQLIRHQGFQIPIGDLFLLLRNRLEPLEGPPKLLLVQGIAKLFQAPSERVAAAELAQH